MQRIADKAPDNSLQNINKTFVDDKEKGGQLKFCLENVRHFQ